MLDPFLSPASDFLTKKRILEKVLSNGLNTFYIGYKYNGCKKISFTLIIKHNQ